MGVRTGLAVKTTNLHFWPGFAKKRPQKASKNLILAFGNHETYFLMSDAHIKYFMCSSLRTHKVFYVSSGHQKVGCVISKAKIKFFEAFWGLLFLQSQINAGQIKFWTGIFPFIKSTSYDIRLLKLHSVSAFVLFAFREDE